MTAPETPINFLLVDDLEENLLALEALLKRDGVNFHTARSGDEALELMLQHDYALALLDVQMPGMDGFELAEFMRANERSRHIPIIFVTAGSGDTARRFRGYEAGAVDFIQKPIETDVLRSKAEVFLNLYDQRRQIAAQRDELAGLTAALRDADQQKNRFLAVLGHELRNPLAVLGSGLNILERANGRINEDEVRSAMRQNLAHVSRLVEDLLDIARIEQGKISLRKELMTLQTVIPQALDHNTQAIDSAGHELTVSIPEGPITLDADPARIIQIVSNLVGNSARYTPDGGRISVEVSKVGEHAVIAVSDNGIGIEPEEQERIFEIFGQAASVSQSVSGGLGIGLALVKELVEMHGGNISLKRSAPGEGSCFEIRLPVA